MTIERGLAPGEKVEREVPFRGYPPLGRALAVLLVVLGLAAFHTWGRIEHELANARAFGAKQTTWVLHPITVTILSWSGPLSADERTEVVEKLGAFGGGTECDVTKSTPVVWQASSVLLTPVVLLPFLLVAEVWRVRRWRRRRAAVTDQRVFALDQTERWIGQRPVEAGEAGARELLRTPVPLLHGAELESVLAPGETVAWEGRPSGLAPGWRWHLALAVVVVAGYTTLAMLGLRWLASGFVPPPPGTRAIATTAFQYGLGSIGVVHSASYVSATGAAAGSNVGSMRLPSPVLLLPLFAAIELALLARFRARRYAVSDRRAFALGWRGRWLGSVARASVARVSVEGTTVVIEGAGETLRFEGLEDPEAARSALEAKPSGAA